MIILEIKFHNYYNFGNRYLKEWDEKVEYVSCCIWRSWKVEHFLFGISGMGGFLNYDNFGNKVP